MSLSTVIKGILEPWATDVTALVGTTTDPTGAAITNPVRVPLTASVPLTGGTAKSTAGAGAPDQTLFQLSGTAALNTNSTPTTITNVNSDGTTATFTSPAGKVTYLTDIIFTGNAATGIQVEVRVLAGATTIFRGWLKVDTQPLICPGIETQPQIPASTALTFIINGNGTTATTIDWFVSGFSQ